jgi:hypothetical protein
MAVTETTSASLRAKAKQSRINLECWASLWIASSLTLLAMTDGRLIVFPSKPLSDVIPDARKARDRESRAKPAVLDRLWIPGQAFGLPGMTGRANRSTGIRMA